MATIAAEIMPLFVHVETANNLLFLAAKCEGGYRAHCWDLPFMEEASCMGQYCGEGIYATPQEAIAAARKIGEKVIKDVKAQGYDLRPYHLG